MYRKTLRIGQKFGSRSIIEQLPERKNGYIMYKVQCECGDIVILNGSYLRTRQRPCKSCSAKKHVKKGKDHYAFKHGYASRRTGRDQVYSVWIAMRARCNDPNNDQYHDYGGRGIKICKEWEDFSVFFSDMGKREKGMQIERIDNNGNYCKQETQTDIQKAVQQALHEERKNNWIKQNGDFYDVMQHAEKLYMKDPELAETILEMPDGFERQKLVYKNIKALGLHQPEEKKPSIQETIDAKRKGPYYQPTGIGTAPYTSEANFSTSGQKDAYAKMQELKNRLRLG